MKYNYLVVSAVLAFAGLQGQAMADPILGTAESFAVLAGSTVTNTGNTVVTGNLGVSPGLAITGFPPGIVTPPSTTYAGGAVALQAESDLTTAYNALAGLTANHDLTGQDLGGLTLLPGVYKFDSSAQLTGTLTLNAQGNANAFWVFQIGSALTTASASAVTMINPGPSNGANDGVFWQIGSSATLGTTTAFEGNILASASITLDTGATIENGRALAETGAVTMDTNTVSNVCPPDTPGYPGPGFSGGLVFNNGAIVAVPEPGALVALASLAGLFVLRGFARLIRTRYCGSQG
jgi:type VI secretion system secreted protein VgrG